MANYFNNSNDLFAWVKNKPSPDHAANDLFEIINPYGDSSDIPEEKSIAEACRYIHKGKIDASEVLFKILANHNLTTLKKRASKMNKEAQNYRPRNKWNRVVDGFNENTPWRIGRDKYYDFTHYYTDEIKFDEDPDHIYSGESIWRTYVMDKFYRDYKDNEGKVVGGYINDRFYVFPTAGTPDNPDAPRDGGNQMALADGERTRKPRPHEFSMERRLEENRGNKLESITASKKDKFDHIIKIASRNDLDEIREDRIYKILVDTTEMRDAGIDYETMLEAISDHYNASITGVAQIDKVAQNLIKKHNRIGYMPKIVEAMTLGEALEDPSISTFVLDDPRGANATLLNENRTVQLAPGTSFAKLPNSNVFQITDQPDRIKGNYMDDSGYDHQSYPSESLVGKNVKFDNYNISVNSQEEIQQGAEELGLNEGEEIMEVSEIGDTEYDQDIPIDYI